MADPWSHGLQKHPLKLNEYLFFITFLWQKSFSAPVGVKPNASHFPGKHPNWYKTNDLHEANNF